MKEGLVPSHPDVTCENDRSPAAPTRPREAAPSSSPHPHKLSLCSHPQRPSLPPAPSRPALGFLASSHPRRPTLPASCRGAARRAPSPTPSSSFCPAHGADLETPSCLLPSQHIPPLASGLGSPTSQRAQPLSAASPHGQGPRPGPSPSSSRMAATGGQAEPWLREGLGLHQPGWTLLSCPYRFLLPGRRLCPSNLRKCHHHCGLRARPESGEAPSASSTSGLVQLTGSGQQVALCCAQSPGTERQAALGPLLRIPKPGTEQTAGAQPTGES